MRRRIALPIINAIIARRVLYFPFAGQQREYIDTAFSAQVRPTVRRDTRRGAGKHSR